jgi:hypothetical protein
MNMRTLKFLPLKPSTKGITMEELPNAHDNVKRSVKIIEEQQF